MKLVGRYLFGMPMLTLDCKRKEIECLVDTGFNGQIMFPEKLIKELGLKHVGSADYVTADGQTVKTKVYLAYVSWFGQKKEAFVVATDTDFSLIGMGLLGETSVILDRRKNSLELQT